jgi:hypothetical protein
MVHSIAKANIDSKANASKAKNRNDSRFTPRKSQSIHRCFSNTIPKDDDDIWVERIVLGDPNDGPRTFFKSLKSNKIRKEPPTGATTIIYLEEIVLNQTLTEQQREKLKVHPMQPPSPLSTSYVPPAITSIGNIDTSSEKGQPMWRRRFFDLLGWKKSSTSQVAVVENKQNLPSVGSDRMSRTGQILSQLNNNK